MIKNVIFNKYALYECGCLSFAVFTFPGLSWDCSTEYWMVSISYSSEINEKHIIWLEMQLCLSINL